MGSSQEEIEKLIAKTLVVPDPELKKSDKLPGGFNPRIWHPNNDDRVAAFFAAELSSSRQVLGSLLGQLERLFAFIEPDGQNAKTYSLELRTLILLACMEVESSWKAILKANEYSGDSDRWKTSDYVKLRTELGLDQWTLQLSGYPRYEELGPFRSWDANKPTQSLDWYNAYNLLKHDREANLKEATLERAIAAVGAAYVMVGAQFGDEALSSVPQLGLFRTLGTPHFPKEAEFPPPYVDPEMRESCVGGHFITGQRGSDENRPTIRSKVPSFPGFASPFFQSVALSGDFDDLGCL